MKSELKMRQKDIKFIGEKSASIFHQNWDFYIILRKIGVNEMEILRKDLQNLQVKREVEFRVKREILDKIDYKSDEMFWVIGILYEHKKESFLRSRGRELAHVYTTPQLIYTNLFETDVIEEKAKKRIMKALNSLADKNIITFLDGRKPKWNALSAIDVSVLLCEKDDQFVEVELEDVEVLLSQKLSSFSQLLCTLLNVNSYMSKRDLQFVRNAKRNSKKEITLDKDNLLRISCFASIPHLAQTKHSMDTSEGGNWVSVTTLRRYLDTLIKLQILTKVTHDVKCCTGVTNHYCKPEFSELVLKIANRRAIRIDFKKREEYWSLQ